MGVEFKKTSSRMTLATAGVLMGGMLMTPAQAADLGGDCCADLEERVAELEATSVRHGNRKVRLKLSGQVNTAVMYFDDGFDSDVFVIDNDEASTRIRLDASGKIRPGLEAGLIIEFDIEVAGGAFVGASDVPAAVGDDVLRATFTKANDDGLGANAAGRVQLRRANWYIKGDMGKISIGQGSAATDGALEVSFANTWVAGVGYGLATTNINAFAVRNVGGGLAPLPGTATATSSSQILTWGFIGTDGDAGRTNRVRIDSPTFAGFTLSASWGEDDQYEAAVRYGKEFNGLKVAAALMYRVDQEGTENSASAGVMMVLGGTAQQFGTRGRNRDTYGGSIAFMHTPSGVHLEGGYSYSENNGAGRTNAALGAAAFEFDHYWVATGVQFRANDLGTTDITVQYIKNELSNLLDVAGANLDYTNYGIGLAQEIDAVSGTAYISYNFHEYEDAFGNTSDMDQVLFGMRLRY